MARIRNHPLFPALVFLAGLFGQSAQGAEKVDFQTIGTLFRAKCFSCHGPEKQRANLRLDTPAGIQEGGDSGPVLEPGKPDSSRLLDAVLGRNGQNRMPPKGDPLSEKEVELVRAWIAEGAKMPASGKTATVDKSKHWSFQPITNPQVPQVAQPAWVKNPIDAFVLARLDREGLKPSPEADAITLMRRVSLDLTGLPPEPAQIANFIGRFGAQAYEKWVDHLLGQPAYGERWARVWLDQARYADSNGYSIDAPRSIWPWRDWVIQALNDDMPFTRLMHRAASGPGAIG